ncbi:S8 family peptidase [Mesorhizobium sp. PAMC28654]|uniref:S8 family peptidase n=1 Tax=Mesorhizobium sp. PAMC28654 TaxID=2880934 RepID=UPI0022234F7E|nr:S8 family peptidase [Mesorhizobium sp. PAMC28654]
MNIRNRDARHVTALLLSTALCGGFPGIAGAQTAGDPTNPQTWKTPEYLAQWGLETIHAADAYAKGVDGSGVLVGVVDSGVTPGIRELIGQVAGGHDYVTGSPVAVDPIGHGTGVASIIAGNRDGIGMHGVAPGAKIVNARIFDSDGFLALDDAIIGQAWSGLLDQGVRIINNSWGDENPITDSTVAEIERDIPNQLAASRAAVDRGALMIFGNGNEYRDQPSVEAGLPYLFPELERGWLAVTAVGPGYIPDYANRCGIAMNWCLAAPGGGDWEFDEEHPEDPILVAAPDGAAMPWSTARPSPCRMWRERPRWSRRCFPT